jgi:hypothetical protein
MVTRRYRHHRRPQAPPDDAADAVFQDQLSAKLSELNGLSLFWGA